MHTVNPEITTKKVKQKANKSILEIKWNGRNYLVNPRNAGKEGRSNKE